MSFDLVVAMDAKRGIGKNNALPWKLSGDLSYFRTLTSRTSIAGKRNAVIMGRKTWESLPPKVRPLKDRLNVIVSRNPNFQAEGGALCASSLASALEICQQPDIENIFVIGGAEIYKEALKHPSLFYLHVTIINETFDCDTFFPDCLNEFSLVKSSDTHADNGIEYRFDVFCNTPVASFVEPRSTK